MNKGMVLALSAYIFWGIHPIYWKLLQNVPSVEIVSHRVVWSFLFFAVIISIRKEWKGLTEKIKTSSNKFILILPAFLIGSNWATYIWAVNAGFIIETSLGYFICPLVIVFLGVFLLKESLRRIQWFSVFIAGMGVVIMTLFYGQFPWISVYLAVTWAAYGLLRKKSPLSSVEGLLLETAVLSIPALIYLAYLKTAGTASFLIDAQTSLLLIGSGIISGFPLIIFIKGARMLNLTVIGILQYVYPTLIFLIGAFVYNETLNLSKLTSFIFIWTALIIYTTEGVFFYNKKNT